MLIRNIMNRIQFKFSSSDKVPIIDIKRFLTQSEGYTADCKVAAEAFHKYGCLIIKDPRVNQKQNDKFLNMIEKYFSKRGQAFAKGDEKTDIYPQLYYQVGATPEFQEKAKDHSQLTKNYTKGNQPLTPVPAPFDAKWRYFWSIGKPTTGTLANKTPSEGFPEFKQTMDDWGEHMIKGCLTVAEMTAIGLGLQRNLFTKMMKGGPHLLAPTASDLMKHKVGTVFAGFHYDFNFLTIHGKSRYPGLFAWLRTGEKFTVQVPQGHLLLQAGKQFQMLTGGYINCGYHQVIYTQQVKEARDKALKEGKIPWRISSTLFSHIRGDVMLQPIGKYKTPQSIKKYPPILASDHADKELEDISLKK